MLALWRSLNLTPRAAAARCLSASGSAVERALVYPHHGQPADVLKFQKQDVADQIGPNEVRLRFLASPVNPSDINQIQGTYPLKPELPAVAGNEGVAEVTEVGNEVENLKIGEWAVPLAASQGTWRTSGVFEAKLWHKVPNIIPLECAATCAINPPTAFCLLQDFLDLQTGDVVVQNGATSAVGMAVIQLAKQRGIRTVNIVRKRPDFEETEAWLTSLGADLVTTEEKARDDFERSGLPKGSLGLNCVGGRATVSVAKLLKHGGTLVTYGGMSEQPVTLPTSLFIFKNLHARGFWWSGGPVTDESLKRKADVIDHVTTAMQKGKWRARTEKVPMEGFGYALQRSRDPHKQIKVLLKP
ncbi:hypothetical protein BSKO_00975 [Bryopsis sp. KO-2023]|nr:hypothetical protein BSKO_00975 [Bryopsis sp. KO-2023]